MWKKLLLLLMVLGVAFAVMMLTTGQSRFQVSDTLLINSSLERAWKVIADVDDWPRWWPGVEKARVTPDLQPGARLFMDLQGNPQKGPATIETVIPKRHLSWQRAGILKSTAATALSLQPKEEGTLVTLETSIHGPQAFLARFTGEPEFARYHQRVLESLRRILTKNNSGTESEGNAQKS